METPYQKLKQPRIGYIKPTIHEHTNMSETVPDFNLSVRDIMLKFAQGLPVPMTSTGYFSNDLPDIRKMDIIDLHNLKKSNNSHIEMLKERQEQQQQQLVEYTREKSNQINTPKPTNDGKIQTSSKEE